MWSVRNVDASVTLCYTPGCPFVICIGRYDVTTVQVETGLVVKVVKDMGDDECPIVHGAFTAKAQRSMPSKSSRSRLASRSTTRSASVLPIDEAVDETGALKSARSSGGDSTRGDVVTPDLESGGGAVPSLDLATLPVTPKAPRGSGKVPVVAVVLSSGDVYVFNAEVKC